MTLYCPNCKINVIVIRQEERGMDVDRCPYCQKVLGAGLFL